MKKTIVAILTLVVLLCSCGIKTEGEFTGGTKKEIITQFEDLAGVSTEEVERFLVPFEFNKPFKSVRFWIETYDYGELVDTIDIFSGPIDNAQKSKKGFIAMYFNNNEGSVETLEFLACLDTNEESITSTDDIAFSDLWGGKELTVFHSTHQPEGNDKIKSGEPRIISFFGCRESDDFEEVTIDLTEENQGKNAAQMIHTPYLLTLNCQFEF